MASTPAEAFALLPPQDLIDRARPSATSRLSERIFFLRRFGPPSAPSSARCCLRRPTKPTIWGICSSISAQQRKASDISGGASGAVLLLILLTWSGKCVHPWRALSLRGMPKCAARRRYVRSIDAHGPATGAFIADGRDPHRAQDSCFFTCAPGWRALRK
jgi:hypothetical protein